MVPWLGTWPPSHLTPGPMGPPAGVSACGLQPSRRHLGESWRRLWPGSLQQPQLVLSRHLGAYESPGACAMGARIRCFWGGCPLRPVLSVRDACGEAMAPPTAIGARERLLAAHGPPLPTTPHASHTPPHGPRKAAPLLAYVTPPKVAGVCLAGGTAAHAPCLPGPTARASLCPALPPSMRRTPVCPGRRRAGHRPLGSLCWASLVVRHPSFPPSSSRHAAPCCCA